MARYRLSSDSAFKAKNMPERRKEVLIIKGITLSLTHPFCIAPAQHDSI